MMLGGEQMERELHKFKKFKKKRKFIKRVGKKTRFSRISNAL